MDCLWGWVIPQIQLLVCLSPTFIYACCDYIFGLCSFTLDGSILNVTKVIQILKLRNSIPTSASKEGELYVTKKTHKNSHLHHICGKEKKDGINGFTCKM